MALQKEKILVLEYLSDEIWSKVATRLTFARVDDRQADESSHGHDRELMKNGMRSFWLNLLLGKERQISVDEKKTH